MNCVVSYHMLSIIKLGVNIELQNRLMKIRSHYTVDWTYLLCQDVQYVFACAITGAAIVVLLH